MNFDLTIAQVQFSYLCFEIPEWNNVKPTIQKIANGKSGIVILHFEPIFMGSDNLDKMEIV